MAILSPPEWLVLDNLRCGLPLADDMDAALANEALRKMIDKGFAAVVGDFADSPLPQRHRITRAGQIALRRSLAEDPSPVKGERIMHDRASALPHIQPHMHAAADGLAAAGFNWQQIIAIIQALLAAVGPLLPAKPTP